MRGNTGERRDRALGLTHTGCSTRSKQVPRTYCRAQGTRLNSLGKEPEKEWMCVCVRLLHFAAHPKRTQLL